MTTSPLAWPSSASRRTLLAAALCVLSLGGCEAYTAIKAAELIARSVTAPAPASTPALPPAYFQDVQTGSCYRRNEPAAPNAPRSFSEVPCTSEVFAQLKLQPRNWQPAPDTPHG